MRELIEAISAKLSTIAGEVRELKERPTEIRHNYTAGAAPTVDDDITQGYSVGSRWADTSSLPATIYICRDNSAGAAVWVADTDGTVTSVALSMPTGFSVTGSPITSSGALAVTYGAAQAMVNAVSALRMFPGLVGLWPGSGLGKGSAALDGIVDMSGNALHLTRNGTSGVTRSAATPLAPFYFFNGVSGYFSHADAAAFDILGTETYVAAGIKGLTMGGWFYFDNAAPEAAERMIGKIGNASAAQLSYMLNHSTAGIVGFAVSDGSNNFTASAASASPAGTWIFFVGRYIPSTSIEILVNGQRAGINTTSIPAALNNSSSAFTVGASGQPGNFMAGRAALLFLCASAVPDTFIDAFFALSRPLFGV